MVMFGAKFEVNFLALFASKPHIFMCGAINLSGIVHANVRLNIAIPMLFIFSLKRPTGLLNQKLQIAQHQWGPLRRFIF